MEIPDTPPSRTAVPRSLPGRIFDVLSGFGLATITLLLLGLLTWFATLEQVDNGLYPTLNKYFATDWRAIFLLPEINGKTVWLPLPGGYWVSSLAASSASGRVGGMPETSSPTSALSSCSSERA